LLKFSKVFLLKLNKLYVYKNKLIKSIKLLIMKNPEIKNYYLTKSIEDKWGIIY